MPAAGDARNSNAPVPRCRHRTTARPRAHRRAASGSGRSDRKFTIVTAALIVVTRGLVLGVVQLAQRLARVDRYYGASFDRYQVSRFCRPPYRAG